MMKLLSLVFLLLSSLNALADQTLEFELSNDSSLLIHAYEGDGEELLLFLPSERGFGPGQTHTAQQLAFVGKDVWMVDLHASHMLPKTPSSIQEFEVNELVELVNIAKDKGFKKLFFVATGRGAQLALKTAYYWQMNHSDRHYLGGHIFHAPHLIDGKPELGGEAHYVAIAKSSNLPVYLMASQYGTKYFRLGEIVEALKTGGSSVFTHRVKGVRGGFHMRPDKDLEPADLKAREGLADTYTMAMSLMQTVVLPDTIKQLENLKPQAQSSGFNPSLKPYSGQQGFELVLPTLDDQVMDLSQFKGQVVLLNFWASWCRPCIKEIPSLMRLKEKLADQPFVILTVNIGEEKRKIIEFKKKIPFDLPVALDLEGKAVQQWGVYAYPSNFLIDAQGQIRYTYRGALEWDEDHVVKTIESVF